MSLDELAGKDLAKVPVQEAQKRNRHTVKMEKLFDQFPAAEQRALIKMVEATVQKKKR